LKAQLLSKEGDIRRLNDRLLSVSEQTADYGRLQCELQQEKERVQVLLSEVQELQRQLQHQREEMRTQNLQVSLRHVSAPKPQEVIGFNSFPTIYHAF
jgi:molecular chaperone GrpE (heat shock protein)